MKSKEQIEARIKELKENRFYVTGKSRGKVYSRIGSPLWREIHAAIKELEWVIEESLIFENNKRKQNGIIR